MLSLRDTILPDRHWVDFVLQHLDPALSLTRNRARIVAIRPETPDTSTFVLCPARPVAFVPGQSVPVRVTLGGVVHVRPYSPTGTPGAPTLSITVKRQRGGTVSGWLHERAVVGDLVELGDPVGDFVLPPSFPARLLFVAGGSGITAVYALLCGALRARHEIDATLLYYARRSADFAFASELRALERRHPALRVHLLAQQPDDGTPPAGRFSPAQLDTLVPDHLHRETFACGPAALLDAVAAHWRDAGLASRLHRESFEPLLDPDGGAGERAAVQVSFLRSVRTVDGGGATLLSIAESAGLRPPSGCRMGICRTCTCTKVAGTVRDRVTGAINDAPMSRIRLCVSEPLGPVTLDL
jgi:ferredoxin-NADP reductase